MKGSRMSFSALLLPEDGLIEVDCLPAGAVFADGEVEAVVAIAFEADEEPAAARSGWMPRKCCSQVRVGGF